MMITDEQTDKVYFSRYIRPYKCWKSIEQALKEHGIHYDFLPNTKDIWARDFMPIQIGDRKFVDYVYDPDYLKVEPERRTEDAGKCYDFSNTEYRRINLKIDGGNVVKCDNKVIMTDKIFKENPGVDNIVGVLIKAFDIEEVVVIPWDEEEEFGHADGMVRFVGPGHVLVNNYIDMDKPFREKLLKALRPHFPKISELSYGKNARADSWAHLNFLRVSDIIFVPQMGIASDNDAIDQIGNIYSGCTVVPVEAKGIVEKGGALNCISWNIR